MTIPPIAINLDQLSDGRRRIIALQSACDKGRLWWVPMIMEEEYQMIVTEPGGLRTAGLYETAQMKLPDGFSHDGMPAAYALLCWRAKK